MPFDTESFVDQAVTPSRRARSSAESEDEGVWRKKKPKSAPELESFEFDPKIARQLASEPQPKIVPDPASALILDTAATPIVSTTPARAAQSNPPKRWPLLKRAHAVSFAGLLLFTAVTYFRPYELIPALSGFTSMAFWLAVATIVVFIPTQISAEGTLTALPIEVTLVLLLALAGLLSVPFAIEPAEAWPTFLDFAKVIAMFIVMVNVVRTERRWRYIVWMGLLVGIVLSAYALLDYRSGRLDIRGERIVGVIKKGLFENPNDLAMHLVTMIPIAFGLLYAVRQFSRKVFYGVLTALMIGATVVTFSRGGFIGLVIALLVIAWKLGRRNRFLIMTMFLLAGAAFVLLMPGDYIGRLLTIFGVETDSGSAISRQHLLLRSILVTVRHPLLGIGMGNFHNVSISEQVSHNAYTQVSAEMGVPAMIAYILFMVFAIRRMFMIERETYESRDRTRIYYLAVGLQAALVGYMVCSFFASVAYLWYIYFLVGYALCLHRLYESKGAEGIFGPPIRRRPSSALDEPSSALTPPVAASSVAQHPR